MAISFLQQNNTWPTSSSTTTPLAFSSSITAASLLWCIVFWNNTGVTCTVADNINGSWTPITGPTNGAGGLASFRVEMFYFPNAGAGSTTVTATFSSAVTRRGVAMHEYRGVATSSPLDQSNYGTPNSNGITTPTISTGVSSTVIASGAIAGTSVTGAGGGYTVRADPSSFGGNGSEDLIVHVAGTYGPNFTEGSTQDNLVGIASFKASTSYLRPSSDISPGDYAPTPSSPTTLYDKLDEATPSDTDYVSGTTSVEVKLT